MNRPTAAFVLFLSLFTAPWAPAPSDCLSGKPTLPECAASQPDLAGFQRDLLSLTGVVDSGLEENVRELLDGYGRNKDDRSRGLLCLWYGNRLAAASPERALTFLTDRDLHRHTALSELAMGRILDILEVRPDLAAPQDPFFREMRLLPDYPAAYARRLFEIYRAGGQWAVARAWLDDPAVQPPPGQAVWLAYARAELGFRNPQDPAAREGAIALFRKVLQSPDEPQLWDRALEHLAAVTGQDPLLSEKEPDRLALADRFLARGDGERAWRCLQPSLAGKAKRPVSDPLWLAAGRAEYLRGNTAAAQGFLDRARPLAPADQVTRLYILALADRRLGHPERFQQCLRQLGRLAPRSEEHLKLLQVAAFEAEVGGKIPEARKHYQAIVRWFDQGPAGAEAWWKLAWQEYVAGRLQAADKDFLAAFERDAGGEFSPAGLYWHGVCSHQLGRAREATAAHDAILQVFPYSYYSELIRQRPVDGRLHPDPVPSAATVAWAGRLRAKYAASESDPPPWDQGIPPADRSFAVEAFAAGFADRAEERLLQAARRDGNASLYAPLAALARNRQDTYWFIWYSNRACPELYMGGLDQFPGDVWRDLFPRKYEAILAAQLQGSPVEPDLVLALIRQESAFWERAHSVSNAVGLMQLLPSTAAAEMGVRGDPAQVIPQLEDPQVNLELGCQYFLKMAHSLGDRVPLALAAYNGGARRVDAAWQRYHDRLDMTGVIEMIPMAQSRNYVKSIYRNWNYYSRLYQGKPADIRAFLGDPPEKIKD